MAKGKFTGGRLIKKGQVLNPTGRPKQKHETIVIQKALRDEIVTRTVRLLRKSKSELEKMGKDPKVSGLDYIIIGIIRNTGMKGDSTKFDVLMNRVIGKVEDETKIKFLGGKPPKIVMEIIDAKAKKKI